MFSTTFNIFLLILGLLIIAIGVIIAFLYPNLNRCPEASELIKTSKRVNKTVLITGANSGIGLATTNTLVELYSTVIMACRNTDTANKIANELNLKLKLKNINTNIIVEKLDLSSMQQIREFCNNIRNNKDISNIHTIICNAGVAPQKEGLHTKDGLELATGMYRH